MTQPNKPKVYLSKSNSSSPSEIAKIRQKMLELDIELVEFSGGTYSHNQLLACDWLVVVPPIVKGRNDDNEHEYFFGKGQSEQITAFRNKFSDRVLIYTGIDFGEDSSGEEIETVFVENYYSSKVVNINWQTQYLMVATDDYPQPLADWVNCTYKINSNLEEMMKKDYYEDCFEIPKDSIRSYRDFMDEVLDNGYKKTSIPTPASTPPSTTTTRVQPMLACIRLIKK